MTRQRHSVLANVLDRVSEPGENYESVFTSEEVACWPDGALEGLIRSGLLQETTPTETITCIGCEERCRRPVLF